MEDIHNPELQQHAHGRAIGRRVKIRVGGRGRNNRGRGGNRRVRVSDEIRATLVDHVINLTIAGDGCSIQGDFFHGVWQW